MLRAWKDLLQDYYQIIFTITSFFPVSGKNHSPKYFDFIDNVLHVSWNSTFYGTKVFVHSGKWCLYL